MLIEYFLSMFEFHCWVNGDLMVIKWGIGGKVRFGRWFVLFVDENST